MVEAFIKKIQAAFGNEKPAFIVKSPGRINLIGEHTDYNHGFALPAAIEHSIYCGIKKTAKKGLFTATALDRNERFNYPLNKEELFPTGAWQNYIIGVVQEIQKVGKKLDGFELFFTGNIPQGAGLSSSAALENAVVFALNELFSLAFSKEEMIKIAQKAEHNYVGVQCGIMDQFTSMFGKKNKVLKLNFLSPKAAIFPLDLAVYELVLINSNVSHELASSEYNVRRKECEQALEKIKSLFPNVETYQDVDKTILEKSDKLLSANEKKRVRYVYEEEMRVLNAIKCIENNDIKQLGEILFAGHDGLRNLYEVTCPETDFLVEKATQNKHVKGARQMGGGFGGCTINVIDKGSLGTVFTPALQEEYFNKFDKQLSLIPIQIGDGTAIIWKDESFS